jgi:hypothetical protein
LRYRVEVKRSAHRDLARLPVRVREQIACALDALAENPRPEPPAGKPLKGYPGPTSQLPVASTARRPSGRALRARGERSAPPSRFHPVQVRFGDAIERAHVGLDVEQRRSIHAVEAAHDEGLAFAAE